MNQIHPKPVVMGVGTAMGAVMLGSLFLGCQPGSLPCDKPEWEEVCALENTGSGGSGGNTSPMASGMGGSSQPSTMTPSTGGGPKCRFNTAAEVVEKLIIPGCSGTGTMAAACHGMGFEPKFTNGEQLLTAVLDVTPKTLCKQDKYVNKADPGKSFFTHKVKGDSSSINCPSGGSGGLRMPFAMAKLSQDDIDCLEWWAFEVSK